MIDELLKIKECLLKINAIIEKEINNEVEKTTHLVNAFELQHTIRESRKALTPEERRQKYKIDAEERRRKRLKAINEQ